VDLREALPVGLHGVLGITHLDGVCFEAMDTIVPGNRTMHPFHRRDAEGVVRFIDEQELTEESPRYLGLDTWVDASSPTLEPVQLSDVVVVTSGNDAVSESSGVPRNRAAWGSGTPRWVDAERWSHTGQSGSREQ